ncbi:hypothetical protein [Nocardia brasiliensis]|uniref:hypothetical protein n=1 Tax=Nocardia brasiliensis TaxID=37326 RepID=UPI002458EE3E|nr:hypothetical protein [Nocardia brasiliensis]
MQTPPVLVIAACGGAGASSITLGLAAAIVTASAGEISAVAVDATPSGGDLALRGCDARKPVSTMQAWLQTPYPSAASTIIECTGSTSVGVRVLARTPDPLPRRESLTSVHRHLGDAGRLPVYDGGSPVTNRILGPLLADPRIGLVIAVDARTDAVNRLQPALQFLDDHYGDFIIGDSVIVVSEQTPHTGASPASDIRHYLGEWVRAVVPIPYDSHLAEGAAICWHRLKPATRDGYLAVLRELR